MSESLLRQEDLKIEVATRHHPGGQHVGTESGVRITHLPTGLVAEAKTERSQHRNRLIAMDMILGGLTSPNYRG
jgi:protein subunit release factor A